MCVCVPGARWAVASERAVPMASRSIRVVDRVMGERVLKGKISSDTRTLCHDDVTIMAPFFISSSKQKQHKNSRTDESKMLCF
jgi:hypothetical protein